MRLKQKNKTSWTLPCSKCGKTRKFSHYASLWAAKRNKSVCHICAGYGNKPGVRLTSEQIVELLRLHQEKKSNRRISEALHIHHNTVAAILKKHGLECNGPKRYKLKRLGGGKALCSKCGKPKPEKEFTVNRRGQRYEYPLSYCAECRKKRDYLNINSSPERYIHRVFMNLLRRAKSRDIPCTITKDQVWERFQRQEGRCFYTDVPMHCRVGDGNPHDAFSIDKIIPERGYTLENVVLCTRRANTIKSDMTLDEMKAWMPGWYARVEKFQKGLQ